LQPPWSWSPQALQLQLAVKSKRALVKGGEYEKSMATYECDLSRSSQ
jgi:hypothetical protein